jgi:hypothetical protein
LLNDWSADVNKLREAGHKLEKDTDELRALQTEMTELENQINVRFLFLPYYCSIKRSQPPMTDRLDDPDSMYSFTAAASRMHERS